MNEQEFNQQYPVGSHVRYYPIAGEPEFEETNTRSEAWTLGSGHVVVKVEGHAGGVSVDHVQPANTCVQADECPACLGEKEVWEYGHRVPCIACNGTGTRR